MPRTNEQNKIIKDQRKQDIFNASVILYSIYKNKITTNQICEKAKCSHGLFYHYYIDTNQIINDIEKSEILVNLNNKLIMQNSQDCLIDIKQSISLLISFIEKAKKFDIYWILILLQSNMKNSYINWLINKVKNGQELHIITPGRPEDIVNIFLYTIIGVLQKKLLQKLDKIQIPPVDNLMQIFIKKTTK